MKKTPSIILVIVGLVALSFVFDNSAYGLWMPRSSQELLEQSQTIFVGNITGVKVVQVEEFTKYEMEEGGILKTIIENYTLTLEGYNVKVEEFLKNPQSFDSIKVRQPTISGAPSRLSVLGGFEAGDRVLFYIDKIDGQNMYSPESFKIPKECDAQALVFSPKPFPSPYEIKQGNLVNPPEFVSGLDIHFSYPVGYNTLESVDHDFEVKIAKIGKKSKEPEFERTFQIHKKTCEWTGVVEWDFVPESGEYLIQISNSYDQSTTTSILTAISIKDPDKIEVINGKPFFVSREYKITRNPDDIISFHGVKFTHPAFTNTPAPGGGAFTEITFQDGAKETLSQIGLLKFPILFTKHTNPQAGMRENPYDTFSVLVGADLTKISPLQQFRSGIRVEQTQCKDGLVLLLHPITETPSCVKPQSQQKLVSRGWYYPVPPEFYLNSDLKNCNKKKDIPDMNCFLNSFRKCNPAKIEQTKYSVEGDPVTVTAIIEKTGKSECKIHAYYDSKDKWGFYGKYDSLCSRVQSQDEFSWIIDQCENKDYSFGIYNK